MKKIVALVAVAVLIITVFTACTKEKKDDESVSEEPETSLSVSVDPMLDDDASAGESVHEYAIPEDAIDIGDLFPEESSSEVSAGKHQSGENRK